MPVSAQITQPKTHKGKKVLENRAPKLIENDKKTLVLKGGHTSQLVNDFLNDICALKNPLVFKLRRHNPVLPFEDISFVEKMCNKYDCSLFVVGLHSKKRPHNIVIGRLHDGELLDLFEFGITSYKPLTQNGASLSGAKPLLLFSGELFDGERKHSTLKSMLIDLFRGPSVEGLRSLGLEQLIQITMVSDKLLFLRTRRITLTQSATKTTEQATNESAAAKPLRAPWGAPMNMHLQDVGLSVNLELRRVTLPSEEKWKRAHRMPPESKLGDKKFKNRHTDVFGSRVGRVHVGKLEGKMEQLRPGSSLRTALTGSRKRGFERHKQSDKGAVTPSKRSKLSFP